MQSKITVSVPVTTRGKSPGAEEEGAADETPSEETKAD
jgi:hypothetical protein